MPARTGTDPLTVTPVVPSTVQEGLWFLDQLTRGFAIPRSHGPAVQQRCRAYQVVGPLDLTALRLAWQRLVRRHEILRTAFSERDGRLVAEVLDVETVPVVADAGPPGRGDLDERAARFCAEQAEVPVDPAGGRPARLVVARLDADRHCLVLVAHHMVADERSMSILVNELTHGYGRARTDPTEMGDPVVPAPRYADVAQEQQNQALTTAMQRILHRWRSTPAPSDLHLPTDRDRPPGPAPQGAAVPLEWSETLTRAVHRLAAAATSGAAAGDGGFAGTETAGTHPGPYPVLLAAYVAVLSRYAGATRVAVAVPVSLRSALTPSDLVGPLENLVVVDVDLADGPTFRQLVDQVDRRMTEVLTHRGLPFARLVAATAMHRDPRRVPLCDVTFTFGAVREPVPHLPGALLRPVAVGTGAVLGDLMLRIDQLEPTIRAELVYRRALFTAPSVHRIAGQLTTALAAAVAHPDTPLRELPLDDDEQLRASLHRADRIADGIPVDVPVHELVLRQARRLPAVTAVAGPDGELSYAQLWHRALAVAAALRDLGAAGRAVVVRLGPGPEQIAALVGVLAAGAHLSWFGTGDVGDRGRAVLTDLRPACLLVAGGRDDPLVDWFQATLGGRVCALDQLRHVLDPDTDRADTPGAAISPDSRAYVAHTSGSTGRPKGIAQSHAAFGQFVSWLGARFAIAPGGRVAQWVAPEHDPAICEVFAALVGGATLCPVPPQIRVHADRLVDWLAEERITHLQTVPSFARELLRAYTGRVDRPPSRLRHLLLMGEALPGELVDALRAVLPGVAMANLYGPTETIAATWHDIAGPVGGHVPVGRSIPGRHVMLLDDDDLPCPVGVTGNIVVRSPYVASGYLDGAGGEADAAFAPVTTLGRFGVAGGRYYRTGDLGRWRADGVLEYHGRRDFQVKLYGNRLELTDVEAALTSHESVREAAVVAVTGPDGLVNRLVAYVVAHRTADGSPDVWRAHLRQRLGKAMLPVVFRAVSGPLPRNVGGKVDRGRLSGLLPAVAPTTRPVRTRVERQLAEIWAQVVGEASFGADDNFFAVGGDSLRVPQVLHQVRQRLGVEVPSWEFYRNPSLSALAALVEAADVQDEAVRRRR